MPRLRKKDTHSRQRQRLIDACISALHIYGPSRTTVEKVVAIAKLSPGIVRFYFASKAAMLVASLQFLANEFEDQVLAPVSRLKDRPVAALQLLVDLYLDPELASPRKVSVWYAFWGEASSRQEYYDICGQKDEGFAALVREIIERLIVSSAQTHLDPDGVALGLIGVLEMLWQDFAFRDEAEIDRAAAKKRAMAYLRSVFPGQFADPGNGLPPAHGAQASLAAWTYQNPRLFALERAKIFQASWQYVAHASQLTTAGDHVSNDLVFERALLVRGADGVLRAFRNSCPVVPHALVPPGSGRQQVIRCAVHGLEFGLDGQALGGGPGLPSLGSRQVGDFVLVRSMPSPPGSAAFDDPWPQLDLPEGARALPIDADIKVGADWKIVSELFLRPDAERPDADEHLFAAPNLWISAQPDEWILRQVLPTAAGSCVLRCYRFSTAAHPQADVTRDLDRATSSVAESIQHAVVQLGHRSTQAQSAQVLAFQRRLIDLLPMMALDQPATDC